MTFFICIGACLLIGVGMWLDTKIHRDREGFPKEITGQE